MKRLADDSASKSSFKRNKKTNCNVISIVCKLHCVRTSRIITIPEVVSLRSFVDFSESIKQAFPSLSELDICIKLCLDNDQYQALTDAADLTELNDMDTILISGDVEDDDVAASDGSATDVEWSKIEEPKLWARGPYSTIFKAHHNDFPEYPVAVKVLSLVPGTANVDDLADQAKDFKKVSETAHAVDDDGHLLFVPILQVISHEDLPTGINLSSIAIVTQWNEFNVFNKMGEGLGLTLRQRVVVLRDVISALQYLSENAMSAHGGVCVTNLYLNPESKRGSLRLCPYPWQEFAYYCTENTLARTSQKFLLACDNPQKTVTLDDAYCNDIYAFGVMIFEFVSEYSFWRDEMVVSKKLDGSKRYQPALVENIRPFVLEPVEEGLIGAHDQKIKTTVIKGLDKLMRECFLLDDIDNEEYQHLTLPYLLQELSMVLDLFDIPLPPPVPEYMLCPITTQLMKDPVVCDDGHTYERAEITKWLAEKGTSPMTRKKTKIVNTNFAIKKAIDDFVKTHRIIHD